MNKNNITKEQLAMVQNAMKHAKDVLCECGNGIFTQGQKFKKVSKLLIGADEDQIVPIPTAICSKCSLEVNFDEEAAPEENRIIK